ncbi:hypothetical protein EV192_121131 [Actinocrispum wychmicini]|uniref:Alpha/beta hydrolase family protein n=1 Tax=Actinocrispum wychmicini TaxID=1213861 RepID=A0A4R2IKZ6_9PSEU|nr:hypothetical protein EV192_121131 [Actinocrispum wychmicini]
MVRKGPSHGPAVVVLDPQGDAKHDELPATWRGLTDDVGVVWWRLPAATRMGQLGDNLPTELAIGRDPIHLVGGGDAALLTLSLAARRPDVVRSVVLVDPPWKPDDVPPQDDIAPAGTVQYVMTSKSGHIGGRLPMGHPDVVAAVVRAVATAP